MGNSFSGTTERYSEVKDTSMRNGTTSAVRGTIDLVVSICITLVLAYSIVVNIILSTNINPPLWEPISAWCTVALAIVTVWNWINLFLRVWREKELLADLNDDNNKYEHDPNTNAWTTLMWSTILIGVFTLVLSVIILIIVASNVGGWFAYLAGFKVLLIILYCVSGGVAVAIGLMTMTVIIGSIRGRSARDQSVFTGSNTNVNYSK